ncbi:MAG TPA: hypothetical protein VEW92_14645 [Nitrososphaeraceae archaeon]|jgi:hypothetical protein|nr:hypothetical protein [Nitrososphaeraceae archaeon]
MNSKIHSIISPSSIFAFTLITAVIPTLFESVLAQNDELGGQQQPNDTGLSQGQALGGTSTDSGGSSGGE